MLLPVWSVRNAAFVLVLILIATAVGVLSYQGMPRSEDPSINLPNYILTVVYPGTSPEDMEELIVDPLEDVLEEVDDLDKVETTISEGIAILQIEALFSVEDWDDKGDEIERELAKVRGELPDGIVLYDFEQFKAEDRSVVHQVAVTSPAAPYVELESIAEQVEDRLEGVPGVKGVNLEAFPDRIVRVSIDFERCAALNIPPTSILGVLRQNNANVPGGDVAASNRSFSIKTTGSYADLGELRRTVVSQGAGKLVYLSDVAEVNFAYEDERWRARYNGERAVLIAVLLESEANIVDVSAGIHAQLELSRQQLPPSVNIHTAFEQAPAVSSRISGFFGNLLQGVGLVGVIILLFLGFRQAVIVMLVIPLCILISLALLNAGGFALQQISIAALVIALGLLVDNGIVVIENINDYLKKGLTPAKAAAKGTGEVGWAIISSTATTVLAFIPLSQLGGGPGEFLKSLPVTVVLTLGVSLLLALTFSPLLAAKLLRYRDRRDPLPQRLLQGFVERVYRPALNLSLRYGVMVILLAVGLLGGAVALFPSIGVSFFPTADKPVLLIDVETPVGSDLEETDRAVAYVESVVDTLAYVRSYSANVGHGNPFVYYNRIPPNYRKNVGQVLVNFREWDPATFYATLRDLRQIFGGYAGARITFQELKNGAPVNAPVEFRVSGPKDAEVERLTLEIKDLMRARPGLINVDSDLTERKTDLKVDLNRDKAGLIGLSPLDFDQSILASLAGLNFDEVTLDDGEDYPLNVRIPFGEEAPGIEDFNRVYLTTRAGAQVPLREVARLELVNSPATIKHYDLERVTTITADVADSDNTIPITEELIAGIDELDWPTGYRYSVGGEYEDQQATFGTLGIVLGLAMLGIFAILVLQFRSLLQPLIVFSALPLAITGSFFALWITGWSFSFFAFVGFVSLSGIVVNNSIILVDYMNQLRADGLSLDRVIREGAERRFVPIVLTTLTTILGLLPLTAQATSLWSPLGWTIIGGMVSSTLLTLLVVPVLYKWLTPAAATPATLP
jgi:multidrug efflux pump subunit AcrB